MLFLQVKGSPDGWGSGPQALAPSRPQAASTGSCTYGWLDWVIFQGILREPISLGRNKHRACTAAGMPPGVCGRHLNSGSSSY